MTAKPTLTSGGPDASGTDASGTGAARNSREWQCHPSIPLEISPLFSWPPRPAATFRWFAANWLAITEYTAFVVLAVLVWAFLSPDPGEISGLEPGWIAALWLRNIALMTLCAGGLHLWLYRWRRQGTERRFERKERPRAGPSFTFHDQTMDNMCWTLASGVTIWTAYEAAIWLAYAEGIAPAMTWSDNPVWFVGLFLVLPVYHSLHFYWIHRLLHWAPLYRRVHAIHHRNVSIGPWSGMSMHPVEHVLYLSALLIFLVVPAHPVHMLFLCFWLTLGAATSHSGYQALVLGERAEFKIGSFFHQLHHRYFQCNYGTVEMPWDRWFGSFHDGTDSALRRLRQRKTDMPQP